jgi:hypothetical protein
VRGLIFVLLGRRCAHIASAVIFVFTARVRAEIFQRLFWFRTIDFSLPVLAFCHRAWSR